MKTKLARISKRSLATVLAFLMIFSTLMVGTITAANAWGVQSGKTVYFVNTGAWSTVFQHFWGSGWGNYEQMTNISGTGVYYRTQSGGDYTGDGFNFDNNKSDPAGSANYYDWVTSNKAYDTSTAFDDMTKLNGTAKVVSMVSTNGGNYVATKSSNCVASISSINISGTSTSATSGSTGSSASEATCYPAYGATVTYGATASGNYEFVGFSTTNSTSLPSGTTTTKSVTSLGYNSNANPATVYAYFRTKTYTVTYNGNGNTGGSTGAGTKYHGKTYTIASNGFTKTGYTFTGWNTKANGSGTGYAAGASYTKNAALSLYAQWQQDSVPSLDTFTIGGATSKTLNIGETATLASTTSNTSNSVTYSTTSDAISITGTTVKALKPVTNAKITASLTGATSKEVTVNVNTPSFTLSYSPDSLYVGGETASPTVTVSNANASSSKSSLSYSITSGSSYASINSSTGVLTSTSTAGTVTAKVTGTISYNGVSYTSATGTKNVTVSNYPDIYINVTNAQNNWSTDYAGNSNIMTYDSAATATVGGTAKIFKFTLPNKLPANSTCYLRVWDGNSNFRPAASFNAESLLTGSGLTGQVNATPQSFTTGANGYYTFYYDYVNHKFYVEYPHTVTFNANGHGTAPSAQVVTYGGKATTPTAPTSDGWTFGGWYKEEGCSNAWNFSTETVTTDKTLYAKWTQNSYSITYPASPTGYTLNNDKPTSAHYNDNISFTVTPSSGYRIDSVTYTPSGGSATNCTKSGTTYSFTMPNKAVTINVTATRTYTVTLTAGTGIATKQYSLGNADGPYVNYTDPLVVATGTDVYFQVKYSTGYEYSSNSGLTVVTANTKFRTGSVTADKSVSITAAKSNYTVTLNKNATDATAGTASVTAQYGSNMPSATMPTRTGYTFAGYYDTNATTGGTQYYTSAGASARTWDKTANTILYARWTEVTGTAVAKAYTNGSASNTGGTVKMGSGTASASVDITPIGIATSKSITASAKTNFTFTGWEVTGANASHVKLYTDSACSTAYTSGATTTVYAKTDGTSGITASNAEIHALFVGTTYNNLTAVGKYSTDGSTYSTDMPNQPTIASTSGTYQTGVNVTAPDVSGYQFITWYSANGDFGNALDKQTKFKPNASNAQAVARYKKIFNITASVDNTGTGAGAAPTISITSGAVENYSGTDKILAGGSYTIAATPTGSYSQIESVTVNGTNKGANDSTTVSSVSADQSVVVKYKSKVFVRGGSTIGTNWTTGDAMQANAEGTEFTKVYTDVAGSSGGTTYEFKLHNGEYVNPDGTATVTITGGNSTGTYSYQTDGLKNNILTLKKNCNITIVSNGSKITSITVRPTTVVQKAITFKHVDGVTITGSYDGSNFTTASADAVVNVYQNDEINFTATAASGKYISALTGATFTPEFSAADTYTGKISNVTAAATVTPAAGNKFTVTAKTNSSARGTVSVDPANAIPGDTVKITVTEKSGTLTSLTVKDANNADVTLRDSRAVTTKYFTMPSSAVTVNATFGAYSAESNWYYNGYDTSGDKVTAYHGKQMTEGMVGGQKFSYYHVEGRTGTDQLMTVSDGKLAETRYVYFTRPKNFSYWNQSNSPKAHFWKNGGGDYDTWPGNTMTWVYDNDMGEAVFKIAIPVGYDRVSFNDASNNGQQQTVDIDLTTTSGAYYVSEWNSSASKYNYGTWNTGYSDQGYVASGIEYFYQNSDHNGDYTADFNTKGFYNHYTASKEFAKPKDLGTSTGDYYVNVLYPSTSYTINGVTKTTGSNPMIIWSSEPLAGDGDTVKVYAKDGAIRSETYGSTYANIADTKIYSDSTFTTAVGTDNNGNISGQTYETYNAGKGDTVYIKTTINTTAGAGADTTTNRNKYYVRGFCINGEVYELKEYDSSGVYTTSYKIPEDTEDTKIEITPIYYLNDTNSHPIVTFRVTDFPKMQHNWGDTLYAYPFYGKLGSQNNAFGAYPGQPLVYYKGQYQIQIPQKSTAWDPYLSDGALSGSDSAKKTQIADTSVSGVTMSNGYYDLVHRQVMGYGDNGASADHVQTYDYGDFYKIFNEKKPVDNIVYDFKFENTKHNFENIPAATTTKSTLETNYGTNGNGFELLTNFHGRHVDLFGTALSGDAADPTKTTPVYVVSIGGVNGSAGVENIAGYYATEWMVYGSSNGTNYTRVTGGGKESIPPEVLVLNDDDNTSFNTTTYPSAVSGKNVTDWKALYTALEAYRGKPVYISYEAADAQIGSGNYATSGGGGATRNDGRWLYSKNGENITGKIKIQYSDDNGVNYTDLNTTTPQVSGLSAYFTNDGVEGEMTYQTTIDPDKTYDFEAKTTNGNYKFVGWYMEDDNNTLISKDNVSHTERSGSYTFVAKFMQVTSGQLILSHTTDTGTVGGTTYNGAGTSKIGVVVKNGDNETVRTYDLSTSDVTLDDKIIKSDSDCTVEVTLTAKGTGEDGLGTTILSSPSGQTSTYFNNPTITTSDGTKTYTFSFPVSALFSGTTQNVKNIIYNSYFTKVAYNYDITFKFQGRLYDSSGNRVNNTFRKQGTLTAKEIENYVTGSTDSHTRYLGPDYLTKIVPYEENLGETINWNFSSIADARRQFTFDSEANTYTLTVNSANAYTATASENAKDLTVTFDLPFEYEDTYGRALNIEHMDKDDSQDNFVVHVNYGQVAKVDPTHGHSTPGSNEYDNTYVTAPKVLHDDDTGEDTYFQYWAVKDKADGKVITKCYMTRFNFVAYDNYYITPVYGEEEYVPDSDSSISTSISYIDTTRNQWNNGGYGNAKDITNPYAQTASDLLFNDFLVSFSYKGKELNSSNLDGVNTGFVVQRLDTLDKYSDGTVNTDISDYEEKYKDQDNSAAIKSYINGGNASGLTLNNISIAANELDNKDRVQWYYSVYNSRGWTTDGSDKPLNNYTYKRYVYRAYSYIKDSDGVTLSDPVYFTMYDKAVK